MLFSLLVWVYCLSVVYFFIDALFGLDHRYPALFRIVFKMTSLDVRLFTFWIVLLFLVIYVSLLGWSVYNKRRFGRLKRRRYPKPASREDMLQLEMLDPAVYEELQGMKAITFDLNPIKKDDDYE
ncbi:poly-beta-1,6-N-acetyl-D-glucosamine biosynthesis protein PgaD [Alkalibacterium putridalgicola]|uniref:Biofilm PGA synthesis protein PgaD n=1 Tax=Alkalibacterium putridalgicola TaxID=426703 RepID=A0ABQ0UV05_9LACT|nr:poly-beta-1,6-N-acetyl-D-glucosamine biosynthesis protein PgaD [Alkalibacterium putridalgicola]GEK88371.1 hypothetical protein APU01nite_04100 [Alkalibacterium putridalgicola]